MNFKMTRTLFLFLALSVAIPAMAAPLEDPAPIAVPAGTSLAQVEGAIKRALGGRRFTVDSEAPGRIVARFEPRTHVAVVAIDYSTTEVLIRYVDSSNLGYKERRDGRRDIHRNYNRWVANVARDIGVFLTQN